MLDAGIGDSLHGERGVAGKSFSDGAAGGDEDSAASGFVTDEGGVAAASGVESGFCPHAAANRMSDSLEVDLRKFMRADLDHCAGSVCFKSRSDEDEMADTPV